VLGSRGRGEEKGREGRRREKEKERGGKWKRKGEEKKSEGKWGKRKGKEEMVEGKREKREKAKKGGDAHRRYSRRRPRLVGHARATFARCARRKGGGYSGQIQVSVRGSGELGLRQEGF
jgi:hypothetical protein